ncbi:MAG: cytochrome c maturation protein CcmE [Chloroflexota bacterium]|nr:cytochrome c maturation protein CcmE [Chloroflexota bacterium]
MTREQPQPARRGIRWGIVAAATVVVAVIAYLALAGIGDALVYYLTPTELVARGDGAVGESVRLGGLVERGSVRGDPADLTFVVTDGAARVTVHATDVPSAVLSERTGVVVEGRLGRDGVFEATQVLVKHDENYVAPSPGSLPPGDGVYAPASS